MKKSFLILICFGLLVVSVFGQSTEKLVAVSGTTPVSKIEWLKSETLDLGKIEKGKPATVTFQFKNTGNEPLLILSAKGQCGCTSVEYPKEAIAPGAIGYIKTTYNAAAVGSFNKTVTVASNASERDIQLHIKGEVY
jgi:hypothetical protein